MDCTLQASKTSERERAAQRGTKINYHQQYGAGFSSGVAQSEYCCSRAGGCQLSWIDSLYPNNDPATLEEVSLTDEHTVDAEFHLRHLDI